CSVHHIIILCLTNTNVNHIQLHPFPTRRSSDLSLRSKAPKYHPALRHRRTISPRNGADSWHLSRRRESTCFPRTPEVTPHRVSRDRKSTRLNSSHVAISYAVFCLKKKIIQSYT